MIQSSLVAQAPVATEDKAEGGPERAQTLTLSTEDIDALRKNNPEGFQDIVSISYEYILLKIAKIKDYTDSDKIDEQVKLSWPVLISSPFFVAIESSAPKPLYELFGEFKTLLFGPGSASVGKVIIDNEHGPKKSFRFFSVNTSNVTISLLKNRHNSAIFNDIENAIKETEIKLNNGHGIKFKNLLIRVSEDKKTPLCDVIKEGIEGVENKYSSRAFFETGSDIVLGAIRSISSVFRRADKEHVLEIIPYEDVARSIQYTNKYFKKHQTV